MSRRSSRIFSPVSTTNVAFNPAERWARDATEEIAEELDRRISSEGREVSEALLEFVESNIGRKVEVQLALPLRL